MSYLVKSFVRHCTSWTSCILAFVGVASGQGTFVYDQQSANETVRGEFASDIGANQPLGQSFTPSLNAVGFVRLSLSRASFGTVGATLYVNLRENSITGNVLAASSPVSVPGGFIGYTDFFFAAQAPVTPGAAYYFQPVIQAGDPFAVELHNGFNYAGGMAFLQGQSPGPAFDLWFREGIYNVPEPSSAALVLLGGAWLAWERRRKLV